MKELYHNKWVRFGFWSVLYVLWVIWLGNYWWLFGLIPIFDGHITKKVKWTFWKKEYKEGEKRNILLDWLDAIIFAVIVVTFINTFFFQAFTIPSSSMENSLYTGDYLFVSKLSYGPKLPKTPLTIPFTHNVIFGKESYSTLIQNDYKRLKGFGKVKKGDYVVFNFPHGDTVFVHNQPCDYYYYVRVLGREYTQKNVGPIKVRPTDKMDHYIKRCVAVAGDTLEIKNGQVYINSQPQEVWPGVQHSYVLTTDGKALNMRELREMGIDLDARSFNTELQGYPEVYLTAEMVEKIQANPKVDRVLMRIDPLTEQSIFDIFPYSQDYPWTRDNYGPLWIPSRGATVELTLTNLPIYQRIITTYEGNTLDVKDGKIYINSEEAQSYTFKQDYYFMMGDNRHNSLDSRYWGFVPEDHIVGKPALIWLSIDGNKRFPNNIRWRRFFKFV